MVSKPIFKQFDQISPPRSGTAPASGGCSPIAVIAVPAGITDKSFRSASEVRGRLHRHMLAFVAMLGLFSVGLKPADAATYYVATGGSDGNPGSQSAPFGSIGKGVAVAGAGDTVYVRGGTYVESVTVSKSGTASAPIKLYAYPGEFPVMDGQGWIPGTWGSLILLTGNYIDVSGFELKNSAQYGTMLYGHHNAVRNMNVHHSYLNGVTARGDYSLVENCQVWQNSTDNYQGSGNGSWGAGLTAARDPVNGITDGAILRGNTVYNNWGEGLSTFEANGTVVEDNIVYDNWAVNFYLSNLINGLARRNIIYATANNPMGRRSTGISLADENSQNPSANITIINNIVYATASNFTWWSGTPNSGMNNVQVANNTFVNANGTNIAIGYGNHQNMRFTNNIVQQDDSNQIAWVDSRNSGLSFTRNLWSKSRPGNVSSWDDIVADSILTRSGSTGAGQLTGDWFKLQSSSPAINKAYVISAITDDYFDNNRDSTPDIGAVEYGGSSAAAPAPSPSPTPSPSNGTNLALNRPAVASTTENGSYAADKAFDGNLQTRWSSQFSDPQWIYVDLGSTYQINRVKIAWEAAYDKGFQIQVSTDLSNWTTIYSTNNGTGGTQDLTGLSGNGRYVKMQGTAKGTPWGHSIWEMEVYGAAASTASGNLALNKTVTASTIENGSYAAQNLVDGNSGTRWSSQFWDPQWVTIDLGAVYNISRVKLLWEAAYARSYKIRVSTDGSNWTDIWSTTTGSGGTVDLTSLSGTGRYVQIYGDARGTGWGYSLWEAEVYGTPWQ